jgi:hypothetical protein
MRNAIFCSIALALALALHLTGPALAQKTPSDKQVDLPKPVEKDKTSPAPAPTPPPKAAEGAGKGGEKPAAETASCTLLTKEAPRGGRLEVQGTKLGKSPVVKIGGSVTRIIERPGDKIAVQIPKKSDGGVVIVLVDGKDVECGTLTIIGLD